MAPNNSLIKGKLPEGVSALALVEAGKQHAIYIHRPPRQPKSTRSKLAVDLPAGTYRAEWVNPKTGKMDKAEDIKHPGGKRALPAPAFREDVALSLAAAGP